MTKKLCPTTINLQKPYRSLLQRLSGSLGKPKIFLLNDLRYSEHLDPITRKNGEFLLDCINDTADLNSLGQQVVKNFFQEVLLNNYEISKRLEAGPFPPIRNPIVILGPPRTGSTYLFNLLGSTDTFRTLRNWETHKPASKRPDLFKKIEALFLLKLQHHLAPGLRTIHEQRLEGPEECTKQVLCSFVSQMFPALFHIPAYNHFLETADYLPTYELYYKQLQILGDHGKRWLLKSPIHTQSIDSLLHVFPDAKIIQLERDSEEVLGSICSLSAGFRCMVSDHIDGKEIGREVRKFLIRDTGKSQKILAEHPKIVLKIHYRQFIDHPIETIQKIFEFTGVKYSDEAESRIKSEMKVSVPNKFGRHIYRLEDYF
ncbi:MAG: sulfotransferase [Akkermansiaceae bacterium]